MNLVEFNNTQSFFKGRISTVAKRMGAELEPYTEHYLVSLLSERADWIARTFDTTMVELLNEASETPGVSRLSVSKEIGDRGLIICSIWPEFAKRRLVDESYYVKMGMIGYHDAANLFRDYYKDEDFYQVYKDLHDNFLTHRDIIASAVSA